MRQSVTHNQRHHRLDLKWAEVEEEDYQEEWQEEV